MKRKSLLFVLPILGMALAGCTMNPDYKKPGEEEHEKDEDEVKFEVEEEVTIGEGQTHKIAVEASGGEGEVSYEVTDGSDFIEVDGSGTVTGLAAGEGVVTVKYNGEEKYCSITVISEEDIVHVEKITVDTLNLSLKKGETHQIVTEFTPENPTNKGLTYVSAKTDVCTVSATGLITAVAAGSTTVKVTSEDNAQATKTINVLVTEETDIEHDGTADSPYTAAEAASIALKLEKTTSSKEIKETTPTQVYIKGTVSKLAKDFDPNYGSYSFWLDDVFEVWQIYNTSDKAKFVEGDIAVGDEVTIVAKIMNFNGTPENTTDAYVYAIHREGAATPTSIKEVKTIPASITQGNTLKASSIVIVLNMSDGSTKEVAPTTVDCDTSVVQDNVTVTLGYTGLTSITTTINVVAPDPVVAGDFYRVKSQDEITAGEYLLVYEASDSAVVVFNGIDVATKDGASGISVAAADGHIAASAGTFIKVALETMDGGFAVKVVGGSNDGKYMSGTSGSNTTNFGDSQVLNTITHTEEGDEVVSNTSTIMYNKTSDQQRFRYYKSGTSTQQPVHLYKMAGGDTPTPPGPTKTLESITIEGTLTNASYAVGQAYSAAGLSVLGHYSDSTTAPVSATVTLDKQTAALGDTKVTASAIFEGKTASKDFDVTVTEEVAVSSSALTIASDFPGGSYAANNYERFTADETGLAFESYQSSIQNGILQLQANAGKIWTTSPISGGITQIAFTSATADVLKVYVGDTLCPDSTTGVELTGSNGVYVSPSGTYKYASIICGSTTGTIGSDVVISYNGSIAAYSIPVHSITLSESKVELNVNGTKQVTATVAPSTAANTSVTWSVENLSKEGCVTVSSTGLVTGVAEGTADLVCTSVFTPDVKATIRITVSNSVVVADAAYVFPTQDTDGQDNLSAENALTYVTDSLNSGNNIITAVTPTKVYKGVSGMKLGSSSAKGIAVFTSSLAVKTIVVRAVTYGTDKTVMVVNGQEFTLTSTASEFTVTLDSATTSISIAGKNASKNRFYVCSMSFYK